MGRSKVALVVIVLLMALTGCQSNMVDVKPTKVGKMLFPWDGNEKHKETMYRYTTEFGSVVSPNKMRVKDYKKSLLIDGDPQFIGYSILLVRYQDVENEKEAEHLFKQSMETDGQGKTFKPLDKKFQYYGISYETGQLKAKRYVYQMPVQNKTLYQMMIFVPQTELTKQTDKAITAISKTYQLPKE